MFFFNKKKSQYKETLATIQELQVLNAELMKRMMDGMSTDNDNQYQTHETQTNAIIEKYTCQSDIGNELIKRLVNVSAALQIPDGIELAVVGEGEEITTSKELHYIQKCSEANALDAAMTTFYARELQKQGQLLIKLVWDNQDNLVKMVYYPWNLYHYKVYSIGINNLLPPYRAIYQDANGGEVLIGEGSEIVFISANTTLSTDLFSSTQEIINPETVSDIHIEGWPTIGSVLPRIDAIGKDLLGWRQSNKLYSYPTPHVKCGDRENAKQVAQRIRDSGWTVGQMLVTGGDFSMVVPQNYYETLSQAITFNLQLISGGTGIAISWLGFPNLMSNRSTSQSMGEPIEIANSSDITAWKTFFLQLFNGMIALRNENLGNNGSDILEPDMIVAKIRPISDRQWKILTEVFMPAAKANLLTAEAFLERIPDFDYKAELARREKVKKEQGLQATQPIQPVKGASMRIRQGKSSLIEEDPNAL
jgi:hypothetical protein